MPGKSRKVARSAITGRFGQDVHRQGASTHDGRGDDQAQEEVGQEASIHSTGAFTVVLRGTTRLDGASW